jgi:hypothetical protein
MLCAVYSPLTAQSAERQGALPQELREYDTDKIRELIESGDFDYVAPPTEPPSLFNRVWDYFIGFLESIFRVATGTPFGKALLYIGGFFLLMVAIIKLLGMNVKDVFYKSSDKGATDFEFMEENIHELDFEKLLSEALEKEDYRLAIRVTYLKTLKHMSDCFVVDWEPGKTNYEYLYEIKGEQLKSSFKDLSYYFDYAWYGDFEVGQAIYQKAAERSADIIASARKPLAETA